MFIAFIFLLGSVSTTASDDFWVTTVISEFRVRDQCSAFWNSSAACSSPLIRISTDINKPSQYASRAWPITSVINSTDRPSFTSQWRGSIESVRVFAQIEGSNKLNPFGRVPKCDEGFHPKIPFNQSSLDIMERLSIRVIVIKSHCFTAKVLVKIDTECPYCLPPTTTTQATITPTSLISEDVLLIILLVVLSLTIISLIILSVVLSRYFRKRSGFKTCPSLESGISTDSNPISVSADCAPIIVKKLDIFSFMPPNIDYEDVNSNESIDVSAMPCLGSLSYNLYSNDAANLSISEPVFV